MQINPRDFISSGPNSAYPESCVDCLVVEVEVPEEERDGEHGAAERGLGARQLRVGLVRLVRAPVHLHLLVVLEEAVADQREVLEE